MDEEKIKIKARRKHRGRLAKAQKPRWMDVLQTWECINKHACVREEAFLAWHGSYINDMRSPPSFNLTDCIAVHHTSPSKQPPAKNNLPGSRPSWEG